MIFPPSFFNSIENLLIHLTYEAKVWGHVQYKWIYPLKRLGIACILSNCPLKKTFSYSSAITYSTL
jgi:hypothetical protein